MVWQSFFAPSNLLGDINFSGVMRDTPLARKCLNAHLTGAGKTRNSAGYYGPSNFRSADGRALTTSSGNYFSSARNITINGAGLPVSNMCVLFYPLFHLAEPDALRLPFVASATRSQRRTSRRQPSTRPTSSSLETASAARPARLLQTTSSATSTSRRSSSTHGRASRPSSSNLCGHPFSLAPPVSAGGG